MSTAVSMGFDLVARSPSGDVRVLRVEASDAQAARAAALRDGMQVLDCVARATPGRERGPAIRTGRGQPATASFAQELSMLLAAGLPIVEALKTLVDNESSPAQRAMLQELVDGIREGLSFSAVLERSTSGIPLLLVATVRASEQTGDLSSALLRYAQHQDSLRALRDKVRGAAVYPMVLLVVGTLVVLFLLGVVVPKFAVLIESARRELPWSSRVLLAWGQMVAAHAGWVAVAAVAGLLALVTAWRRLLHSQTPATWIEALPLVGPLVRQFRHAQLYRTTGMLVSGGIPAPRALELATDLLGQDDRNRMGRAISLIREGRSISDALQAQGLADPVAASMLAVAERTGGLAEILGRIASFQESRLQRAIDVASKLAEPLLMIVIGLVIGTIVVLMYLPIFDLASSLQ